MTSEEDTPRARRAIDKGRLESFSDGVFGFAATLLVADLAIHPPGNALAQVLRAWPSYLAYVVSFLTIGAAWLAHTALTDQLAQADRILLRLNLLLLIVVVFLPFPTRLVAGSLHQTGSERVFVTMLGLNLLAIRAAGFGLDAYARRGHLYKPEGRGRGVAERTTTTAAHRRRVPGRDPHRARSAERGCGGVFRCCGLPGLAVPGAPPLPFPGSQFYRLND